MTFSHFLPLCFLYFVKCHDSDSSEGNRIELTPFYDTIIFNDIADIMNEFESNVIPSNTVINSESESDENIEDLLSEYQHYLEKAHKQKRNYIEKTKAKNKVPLLRRDKFTKSKPAATGTRYNDYYYSNTFYGNPNPKLLHASPNNPLDLFIPLNTKVQYFNNFDLTTTYPKMNREDQFNFEKIILDNKRLIDLPRISHKSMYDPIKSSCFCKNNQIPCECDCKQCLMPFDSLTGNRDNKLTIYDKQKQNIASNMFFDYPLKNSENRDNIQGLQDNNPDSLTIRIKLDVQLPKLQYEEHCKNQTHYKRELEDVSSKESATAAVNVPFPYFNFPIPLQLFGYKKNSKFSKHDSSLHKITIHKKKKAKLSSNKKHRKKVITIHNLKLEPQQTIQHMFEDNYNLSDSGNKSYLINETHTTKIDNATEKYLSASEGKAPNKTDDTLKVKETRIEEKMYIIVNVTNNIDNVTEDSHKIGNSIETEYTKVITNATTSKPLNIRKKREIGDNNLSVIKISSTNIANITINSNVTIPKVIKSNKQMKIPNKGQLTESELMFWPKNTATSIITLKNITTIIIEREKKKANLNISSETMKQNHNRTLEQAIFGQVDWDDVNTIAPIFMSFIGKYVRGVLTFCSETICHSMKCADKTCMHRTCAPDARVNRKGHCAVSNTNDGIVSMDSTMDLPSNIAFEIVDILQERMLGKLFGKTTICINSKCITFVASKKIFLKSKCSTKELQLGHCPNIKTAKIIS